MAEQFILDGSGRPVPCADLLTWARWLETADRVVGHDTIGDVRVSTVFIGLAHGFRDGQPLLFETMIFGGAHDEYQERYPSRDEAVRGHQRALQRVMDATVREQIESAAYRDAILTGIEHASAAQLAHLADRAILAAAVITEEFERRFPAEFAAWDRDGGDDVPTATDQLYAAVKYVLDRAQDDPDVGYYIGPGTQMFHLLCQAEAAHVNRSLEAVERERGQDLQPEYRRRQPEVTKLRDERDQAREASERGRHWAAPRERRGRPRNDDEDSPSLGDF